MAKGPKPKPLEEKLKNFKLGGPRGTCWEWQGSINPVNGYGLIYHEGRSQNVHRVACKHYNPNEPHEDLLVLHSCDNRRCISPDHLSFGTPQQNAREAVERGGMKVGEESHSSVLTNEKVGIIRMLLCTTNFSQEKIAGMFGVTRSTISLIKRGKRWSSSL